MAANIYLGLKVGLTFASAIPAAGTLSFVIFVLPGLLIAALIGFSGADAPLALVGEGFAPVMWLGLACLAALGMFFYRRVVQR